MTSLTSWTVGVGGAIGNATNVNLEAWERDFRINVTSMVMMSRYAIPEMRKQGRGSIINISSVSGCKSEWLMFWAETSQCDIFRVSQRSSEHR